MNLLILIQYKTLKIFKNKSFKISKAIKTFKVIKENKKFKII